MMLGGLCKASRARSAPAGLGPDRRALRGAPGCLRPLLEAAAVLAEQEALQSTMDLGSLLQLVEQALTAPREAGSKGGKPNECDHAPCRPHEPSQARLQEPPAWIALDQVGGLDCTPSAALLALWVPNPQPLSWPTETRPEPTLGRLPMTCPCLRCLLTPSCAFHVGAYKPGAGAGRPTVTKDAQSPERGGVTVNGPACKLHAQHAAAGGAHCVARRRGCCRRG